jgi:hypothetical protein
MLLAGLILGFTGCSSAENEISTPKEVGGTPTLAPDEAAGQTDSEAAPAEEPELQIPEDGIAFSQTGYFYTDSVNVEILSNKPGKIYYTLDGTDPAKKQTLYSGPIRINTGSPVKATSVSAIAYFDDGTESDIITHTYFVGKKINSRFDTLIFSVTTDPYNLYDYNYGIFVEGKLRDDFIKQNPGVEINPNDPANFNMRGKDSEREVFLEVLEPNGKLVIGQAAGIRTYGGWSRARAQKSFKIYARKEYDENKNKLDYEFFPFRTSADGNVIDTFKQVVLRNCGNDNGFGFVRDELFETLASQAGYKDYEAVRPAAVFVNGDYRGFFWLHETYCDEYFEDHYGKYDGSFEILEGGETYKVPNADGDNSDIISEYDDMYFTYSSMDLTDDTNYQNLCKVFDVENYLDYYALQVYIGNEDWPHNNYKTYRYYVADGEEYREAPFDGKWRFMLHDLDFSFGIYGTPATTDFLAKYFGVNGEIMDTAPIFGQLMRRPECRDIFVRKTLDLINGVFSEEQLYSELDRMHKEQANELSYTYNRGLLEDWVRPEYLDGNIDNIKSYTTTRASYVLNSYTDKFGYGDIYKLDVTPEQGCSVRINSYITDQAFEGHYYTDLDTMITAVLPEGRSVDYWLVNGEKVEGEVLVITTSMVKDLKAVVSFVTR